MSGSLGSLVKQSFEYLAGRSVAMAVGFVSFPVYARLLSVADYGILNLAQRFSFLGVAVGKLGMQNAVVRFYEEDPSEEGLSRLYSTTFLSCAVGAALCSLLCALALFAAPDRWIQPAIIRALLAGCGLIFLRSVASPLYGFLRVEGRPVLFNALDVLTRVLSLAFGLGLLLLFGRSPENLLFGVMLAEAAAIAVALIWLVPPGRLSVGAFDWTVFRSSMRFGIPLAGSEVVTIALGSTDRALIQHYLGSEPLGYYAAASAMAMILQEALQTPMNLALVPIYTKIWQKEGPRATADFLARTFTLFMIAACAVTAVIFASSRELIVLVSSERYTTAAWMLGPLVAGYMCTAASVILGAGFWVQKATLKMAPLVACALVIKTILNVVLLPSFGLWGAVIPAVVGCVALAVLYGWHSHRLLPLRIPVYHCACCIAAAAVSSAVAYRVSFVGLLPGFLFRSLLTLALYVIILQLVSPRFRDLTRAGMSQLRESLARA